MNPGSCPKCGIHQCECSCSQWANPYLLPLNTEAVHNSARWSGGLALGPTPEAKVKTETTECTHRIDAETTGARRLDLPRFRVKAGRAPG